MPLYLQPATLAEAVSALHERPLVVLAGGTDFFPARVGRPLVDDVLDVARIRELRGIDEERGALRIGAATPWSEVRDATLPAWFGALQEAAREIGGDQVQNAGTIGGNLCNASPAADGVPPLLALDARVELASTGGLRELALGDFVLGPRRTALRPDEILVAVRIPMPASAPAASAFRKLGSRRYLVISFAMAAAAVELDESGRIAVARISVGACSPVAVRLPLLEQALLGRPAEALRGRLSRASFLDVLSPISDVRADAEYRREAAGVLVTRVLRELADRFDRRGSAAARGRSRRAATVDPGDTSTDASGTEAHAGGGATPASNAATDASAERRGRLRFRLNGVEVTSRSAPLARLADVVRDEFGLTGTKIGCNAGDCGACTVLVDGRQVCSCCIAVAQVAGRTVTTVEGFAQEPWLAQLQHAFHRHLAAQCGICTPGMLAAAADLLARVASPTARQVEDALGGVLCRCTGYRNILAAVLDAADDGATTTRLADSTARADTTARPGHARADAATARPGETRAGAMTAPPADPTLPPAGHAIGARVAKVDGLAKVLGSERFGADSIPADALWLRVIRSPHAHARFEHGGFAELRARRPGIARVLTARDVPSNGFGIYPTIKDQPVLADGVVRFRGEAVVALVGDRSTVESTDEAELGIAWTPLPPLSTVEQARADDAPRVLPDRPGNVLADGSVERGDPESAFAAAAAVAEGTFRTAFVEHAYIEPEAGWAVRRPASVAGGPDRLEIHVTTQTPYMDRDEVALILALAKEQVRIVPTACGGGFGGKLDLSVQPLVGLAAWLTGRPVACVYSRPESMMATTKRHPATIAIRAAADAGGRLLAVTTHAVFNTGAYASWGPTVANRVPVHATGPYFVPHVRNRGTAILTHNMPAGAFRGFGVPQAAIAHEAMLDDLAAALGIDRLEIRRRNALKTGDTTATGQQLVASCGLPACLDALAPHWAEALADAERTNAARASAVQARAGGAASDRDGDERGLRRGVGIGCMWYGIGNTSLSNPSEMSVGLSRNGRITLYNGCADMGQGTNTTMIQACADGLGMPMALFDWVMGDTDRTLDAGKSSASRQAFVSGNAALAAGRDLRRRMLALLEAPDDSELMLDGTVLAARHAGGVQRIDVAELPFDASGDVLVGRGRFDPPTTPLDEKGQGVPYATYAFAAQMAVVDVDVELGTTNVVRIVAAHDVGRALNPQQVEGQIHGGIAQGLGLALMEEYVPGRTENLHDYLVPTAGDVPPIEVLLIEDREPLGPGGAKGVGEPALIPTPPAILGAIRHATGVRIDTVPATPPRLRAKLRSSFAI